jgi:hypothetical protein
MQDGVIGLACGVGECCLEVIGFQVGKVTQDFVVRDTVSQHPENVRDPNAYPRMHGRPSHLSGSTVMRSRRFIPGIVPCRLSNVTSPVCLVSG